MKSLPDYEVSYEADGDDIFGDVLAYNLKGHGHAPEVIDLFLALEVPEWDASDEGYPTEWEVREDWLRKVPANYGSLHVYGKPGRGATAVTVIERSSGWNFWCLNHEFERATTGIPAVQIVDGEQIVACRLAELAEHEDPRVDVADNLNGAYIYMCRDCSNDFHERLAAARWEACRALKDADR